MDATKVLVIGAIGVLVAILVATTKVVPPTPAVAVSGDDDGDIITPSWAANVPIMTMAPPLSYMMPTIADSPTALPSGPGCAVCS